MADQTIKSISIGIGVDLKALNEGLSAAAATINTKKLPGKDVYVKVKTQLEPADTTARAVRTLEGRLNLSQMRVVTFRAKLMPVKQSVSDFRKEIQGNLDTTKSFKPIDIPVKADLKTARQIRKQIQDVITQQGAISVPIQLQFMWPKNLGGPPGTGFSPYPPQGPGGPSGGGAPPAGGGRGRRPKPTVPISPSGGATWSRGETRAASGNLPVCPDCGLHFSSSELQGTRDHYAAGGRHDQTVKRAVAQPTEVPPPPPTRQPTVVGVSRAPRRQRTRAPQPGAVAATPAPASAPTPAPAQTTGRKTKGTSPIVSAAIGAAEDAAGGQAVSLGGRLAKAAADQDPILMLGDLVRSSGTIHRGAAGTRVTGLPAAPAQTVQTLAELLGVQGEFKGKDLNDLMTLILARDEERSRAEQPTRPLGSAAARAGFRPAAVGLAVDSSGAPTYTDPVQQALVALHRTYDTLLAGAGSRLTPKQRRAILEKKLGPAFTARSERISSLLGMLPKRIPKKGLNEKQTAARNELETIRSEINQELQDIKLASLAKDAHKKLQIAQALREQGASDEDIELFLGRTLFPKSFFTATGGRGGRKASAGGSDFLPVAGALAQLWAIEAGINPVAGYAPGANALRGGATKRAPSVAKIGKHRATTPVPYLPDLTKHLAQAVELMPEDIDRGDPEDVRSYLRGQALSFLTERGVPFEGTNRTAQINTWMRRIKPSAYGLPGLRWPRRELGGKAGNPTIPEFIVRSEASRIRAARSGIKQAFPNLYDLTVPSIHTTMLEQLAQAGEQFSSRFPFSAAQVRSIHQDPRLGVVGRMLGRPLADPSENELLTARPVGGIQLAFRPDWLARPAKQIRNELTENANEEQWHPVGIERYPRYPYLHELGHVADFTHLGRPRALFQSAISGMAEFEPESILGMYMHREPAMEGWASAFGQSELLGSGARFRYLNDLFSKQEHSPQYLQLLMRDLQAEGRVLGGYTRNGGGTVRSLAWRMQLLDLQKRKTDVMGWPGQRISRDFVGRPLYEGEDYFNTRSGPRLYGGDPAFNRLFDPQDRTSQWMDFLNFAQIGEGHQRPHALGGFIGRGLHLRKKRRGLPGEHGPVASSDAYLELLYNGPEDMDISRLPHPFGGGGGRCLDCGLGMGFHRTRPAQSFFPWSSIVPWSGRGRTKPMVLGGGAGWPERYQRIRTKAYDRYQRRAGAVQDAMLQGIGPDDPRRQLPNRLESEADALLDRLSEVNRRTSQGRALGGGVLEIGKKGQHLFSPPTPGWVIPHHLIDKMPLRGKGGGAGHGTYLVGEAGSELFVPEHLGQLIPKTVMDQLPKRAGGGGAGRSGGLPMEGRTGFQSAAALSFGTVSAGNIQRVYVVNWPNMGRGGAGLSANPMQGGIAQPTAQITQRDKVFANYLAKQSAAENVKLLGAGVREQATGEEGAPPRRRRARRAEAEAGEPAAPSVPKKLSAVEIAQLDLGSLIEEYLPTGVKARIAQGRETVKQQLQMTALRSPTVAAGEAMAVVAGGRGGIQERARMAELAFSKQQAIGEKVLDYRRKEAEIRKRMALGEGLGIEPEEMADLTQELEDNKLTLGVWERGLEDAGKETDILSSKVASIPQKLRVFGTNLLSVAGGMTLYTSVLAAAQAGTELASTVYGPFVERLSGYYTITNKITSSLADNTRKMSGQTNVVIAAAAAEAGLSDEMTKRLNVAIKQRVVNEAGSKAFSEQLDLIRAMMNIQKGGGPLQPAGGIPGLTRSTGGLFGTPIMAQPSIVEQLSNELTGGVPMEGLGTLANFAVGGLAGANLWGGGGPGGQLLNAFTKPMPGVGVSPIDTFLAGNPLTAPLYSAGQFFGVTPVATQNEQGYAQFQEALKGLNENATKTGSSLQLMQVPVNENTKAIFEASKASMMAAGVSEDTAKRYQDAGYAVVDTANGLAKVNLMGAQQFFGAAAQGMTQRTPKQILDQSAPQRLAAVQAARMQAAQAITTTNPAERFLQYITNRPTPFGATFMPPGGAGMWGEYGQAAQKALDSMGSAGQSAFNLIESNAEAGRQALYRMVGTAGRPLADELEKLGKTSKGLQLSVMTEQATLSAFSYNNQLRIASRSLEDAKKRAGERSGTEKGLLGVYERQNFQLSLQSQRLSQMLSQRQINFQKAVAGFVVPGLTPEEQYARVKQAQIEADFAQQQLDIQKQQTGLGVKVFDESNIRAIKDAQAALTELKMGMQLSIDSTALSATTDLMKTLESQIMADVSTYSQEWSSIQGTMLSDIATITSETGLAISSISTDVMEAWNDFSKSAVSTMQTIYGYMKQWSYPWMGLPEGGGGGGAGGPKMQAAGFLGNISGATQMVVGEAGAETVAILRNPREILASMGQSYGPAGYASAPTIVNISISGGGDINEEMLRRWGRQIVRDIDRGLGRTAALIGMRDEAFYNNKAV